ncbi:MAG: MATE family efflux transporter, partial [Clostridia bacterium]|nr:MATE family efflux transporter [Clostridia bacterium]
MKSKEMTLLFSTRDLFQLILPLIVQQVLQITVNTVDSMMVASAGEAAVSGVSLVGTLDAILVIAFSSLVTGGTVAVSHALGEGNKSFGRECAKQLIYVSGGIALAIAVLVGLFRMPILNTLYGSAERSVLENANAYLGFMLISFPFLAVLSSGAAIFRTMGDTVTGLRLSILTNILNVIGNAIFIYGFHMGAAGAALSTLIARVVYAVIIIAMLHDRKRDIYIEKLLYYRPNMPVIKKMLRIGVPHGIESSMFQFGRLATQVLISAMGTAAIAANSVANTLANYMYLPASAIDNAAITVVGRCYGANLPEEAKRYSRTLLLWVYICMWAISVVLFLFAKPIIGIYNLSAEGSRIALELTFFHCVVTSLVRPLAFSLPSIFKSTGDAKFTMVVSTLSMWIVRVGMSFVLAPESVQIFG